jgi:hypothetical protein
VVAEQITGLDDVIVDADQDQFTDGSCHVFSPEKKGFSMV